MKRLHCFALSIIFFSFHPSIAQQSNQLALQLKQFANDTLLANDTRLQEHSVRKVTADEVLNRTIRWTNPYSDNQKLIPNLFGLDISKFSPIPSKGVHPRIFVSPSEFSSVKQRLENTKIGKTLLSLAQKELSAMQNGMGENGKKYIALKNSTQFADTMNLYSKDFSNLLSIQALLAQLNDDKDLLKETGIIAGLYLRNVLNKIAATPPVVGRELAAIEPVYSSGALAKLFDFAAAGMTDADKLYFIKAFAKETFGKISPGMELPDHWRRWNHMNLSVALPLSVLAIENEKGYDKRIFECGIDMMKDYLTYGFTKEGMSCEGIGYTFGSFDNDMLFLMAAAKRGNKDLLGNPHFRSIPDWLIYALAANPDALWNSHGDTGSTADIPWVLMMMLKYCFPDDARIDYLYANSLFSDIKKAPDVAAYVFCNDPAKTKQEYNGIPPISLPLNFFSPERGSLIARNKWDKNGIMFQFDGRQDMLYQSHDHSDRGNFWLASHGRIWVMDGWRSTESKYHSVITIDGHGQGYFATPASWKNFTEVPEAVWGTIDYKYCMDWSWLKSPVADMLLGKTVEPQWREGVYAETAKRLQKYYPGVIPQRDPLRKTAQYFSGNLATNPLIWEEDTWPMRIPNYPVEYAFRSAGLIKGKHDYVLIMDDLQKDGKEHLYEWAMPMQLDVELVSIKQLVDVKQESGALNIGFNTLSNQRKQGEYDITLGDKRMKRNMTDVETVVGGIYSTGRFTPKKGDPQLLVRVLESTEAAIANMEPNPRLETFENIKTEDMHQFYLRTMDLAKRLVVPSRSINPNFKVLLFPYLYGEELPKTLWNDNRTKLTVSWSDQQDEFTFTKTRDGHTQTKLVRDGKVIFE